MYDDRNYDPLREAEERERDDLAAIDWRKKQREEEHNEK